MRPYDDHRGLGGAALYVLHPGLEAAQTFFPVQHVPEEEVEGASGEEALVCGVVLLLRGGGEGRGGEGRGGGGGGGRERGVKRVSTL